MPIHPHLAALSLPSHELVVRIADFTYQKFPQQQLHKLKVIVNVTFVCLEIEERSLDVREANRGQVFLDVFGVAPGARQTWRPFERWQNLLNRGHPAWFGPASEPCATSFT